MKKILLLLALFVPAVTLGAGLQVNPDKLVFNINGAEPRTEEMIVVNPTADVQLFEVYADDYARLIKVNPASFTLESGARKKVLVTITPDNLPAGIISANLSVVSEPLISAKDQNVGINTGVKIPFTIQLSNSTEEPLWQFYGLLALGCLVVIGLVSWLIRRRRKGIHLFGKKIIDL
jgi:hypothetical protein